MIEKETCTPMPLPGKTAPLRFAVMCNGTVFQRWQADALKELKDQGHNLVLLIVDAREVTAASRVKRLLKKKWSTILFTFLDNRIFKPAAKDAVDLQQELTGIEMLECLVQKRGYSEYFRDEEIESIRRCRPDFILRFGFNILRGDILTAARFGVWSFHHDDEMSYRGGPPGFWEIFRGDPVNGAILQRLTEKLDGGIILKKGYLKTLFHSYRENIHQLLSVSASWPAQMANEMSRNLTGSEGMVVLPAMPASATSAPLYKIPGNLQMLKFLLLLIRNRLRFYYHEMLAAEIWNVGLIMKPLHEVALGTRIIGKDDVTWLPVVAHTGYLADPAGFHADGRLHVLAEDYSYARQKAGISEIIVEIAAGDIPSPGMFGNPVSIMDGGTHRSYPYVFEHQGRVYCLPESYQSSQITLFRREDPGGRFVKERVILDGVRAVDPTLFFYNGWWWLFFTERKYSNTHLYLYHSKDLTGEFAAHPLNPVKTDIRSARPAGTPFVHENVLYRPAQDCSATYGGRVAINRVLRLTPGEYYEETVRFIEPVKGSPYDKGLHTLSAVGNVTLVDGKKYQLNRLFFSLQLRKKLTRKDRGNV